MLFRVVRQADGLLRVDRTGPGRGAWLCRESPSCVEEASTETGLREGVQGTSCDHCHRTSAGELTKRVEAGCTRCARIGGCGSLRGPQSTKDIETHLPKKIRVYELAKELGLTNKEGLDLALSLGIGVKSHSSSIEDAQADRVRRKADAEGLRREVTPEEPPAPPAPAPDKRAAGRTISSSSPATARSTSGEARAPRLISSRPTGSPAPSAGTPAGRSAGQPDRPRPRPPGPSDLTLPRRPRPRPRCSGRARVATPAPPRPRRPRPRPRPGSRPTAARLRRQRPRPLRRPAAPQSRATAPTTAPPSAPAPGAVPGSAAASSAPATAPPAARPGATPAAPAAPAAQDPDAPTPTPAGGGCSPRANGATGRAAGPASPLEPQWQARAAATAPAAPDRAQRPSDSATTRHGWPAPDRATDATRRQRLPGTHRRSTGARAQGVRPVAQVGQAAVASPAVPAVPAGDSVDVPEAEDRRAGRPPQVAAVCPDGVRRNVAPVGAGATSRSSSRHSSPAISLRPLRFRTARSSSNADRRHAISGPS